MLHAGSGPSAGLKPAKPLKQQLECNHRTAYYYFKSNYLGKRFGNVVANDVILCTALLLTITKNGRERRLM